MSLEEPNNNPARRIMERFSRNQRWLDASRVTNSQQIDVMTSLGVAYVLVSCSRLECNVPLPTHIKTERNEAPWHFWLDIECRCGAGWIPSHSRYNTMIALAIAVPELGHFVSYNDSSKAAPDLIYGGCTWIIEKCKSLHLTRILTEMLLTPRVKSR